MKLQIFSLNQNWKKVIHTTFVHLNNSHNIRPSKAITANEINTSSKKSIRTVPGNRSFASTTKHGKKYVSRVIAIHEELTRIYLIIQ